MKNNNKETVLCLYFGISSCRCLGMYHNYTSVQAAAYTKVHLLALKGSIAETKGATDLGFGALLDIGKESSKKFSQPSSFKNTHFMG